MAQRKGAYPGMALSRRQSGHWGASLRCIECEQHAQLAWRLHIERKVTCELLL